VSRASVFLLAELIIGSILIYLISTAEAKVDSMNSQDNSTVNPDVLVPETLSFKRPGYLAIVQVPLIAVLHDGNVTVLKEDKYPGNSTYLLTSYNPIFEFQFRQGSKIPLQNIKQILIGEVKPYRNNSDALDSAYVFRNISFNADTVLELENDGFSYMVIEAQFANNVSGIYALGFENTPDDSNEIGYRQSLQQKYKHDGLTVLNASSIKVNSDDSFLSVAESIMCHITSGYGFQVCKTTPKISVHNYSKGEESDSSSSTVSTSQSNEAQSYSNSKLGISLKHPTDWKVANLKNGIQFIKEKNGVYVEIRKHNLESPDVQLKQYVGDDIKDRSSSRQDLKLLNITNTTISGNLPAYKTEYTFLKTENQKDFTINGTTNKILRFWTFANGNAYTVAYVSERQDYDLNLPIALEIIDTLKINPGSQQSFSDNDSKDNDNDNDSKDNDNDNDNESKNEDDGGDKDCSDFDKKNFKVQPGDPYDLDRDGDGIACEDSKDNDNDNDSKDNDNDNDNESKNEDDGGDKDCSDFDKKNFKVQPGDPYDLDRDGDGIACED
jgi:PsbP-like protein